MMMIAPYRVCFVYPPVLTDCADTVAESNLATCFVGIGGSSVPGIRFVLRTIGMEMN